MVPAGGGRSPPVGAGALGAKNSTYTSATHRKDKARAKASGQCKNDVDDSKNFLALLGKADILSCSPLVRRVVSLGC